MWHLWTCFEIILSAIDHFSRCFFYFILILFSLQIKCMRVHVLCRFVESEIKLFRSSSWIVLQKSSCREQTKNNIHRNKVYILKSYFFCFAYLCDFQPDTIEQWIFMQILYATQTKKSYSFRGISSHAIFWDVKQKKRSPHKTIKLDVKRL